MRRLMHGFPKTIPEMEMFLDLSAVLLIGARLSGVAEQVDVGFAEPNLWC
jgi:hypothetical protein